MVTTLALVATLSQTPTVSEPPALVRLVYPLPDPKTEPDLLEQVTVGSLFASSSVSMVPVWITAVCTTDKTCTELNPVMRKVLGEGPIRASIVKGSLSFVAHYGIWRITQKQRIWRLVGALALLGVNVWDAVHDVKVLREIDRSRGR